MQCLIKNINSDFVSGILKTEDSLVKLVVLIDKNIEVPSEVTKIREDEYAFFCYFDVDLTGIYDVSILVKTDKIEKKIKPKKVPFLKEIKNFNIDCCLPKNIVNILCSLDCKYLRLNENSKELVSQALDDVMLIAERGGRALSGEIHNYLIFLSSMKNKFNFILGNFPKVNSYQKDFTQKDSWSVLTSTEEMLAIANQLYVLKSYGITGDVLEFGCFKGFSSSCLSHACMELGLNLVVFDSFEGLPFTNSKYYAKGDFKGDFNEVFENIKNYGVLDIVDFRKGYFSETVDDYKNEAILIWADVDLSSSMIDVCKKIEQLNDKGCVFVNECMEDSFVGNQLKPIYSEDEPIGVLQKYFEEKQKEIKAIHITGDTGAICLANCEINVIDFQMFSTKVIEKL